MNNSPGRRCPVNYRHPPEAIGLVDCIDTDILYVVGGLYGNGLALDALEALTQQETSPVTLCFNGDFNWFNIDPDSFQSVNQRVFEHRSTRGNVETELSSRSDLADCGCGYPDYIADGVVTRSNQIITRLKKTARDYPHITAQLADLPMFLRFRVAGTCVSVIHGDPESLSGWGLAQEVIDRPDTHDRIKRWCATMHSSIIACTHTCLPYLYRSSSELLVANNGSAGMPNFRNDTRGLITRIAVSKPEFGRRVVYGTQLGKTFVDAIALDYDQTAWVNSFDAQWEDNSPASLSYRSRLMGDIDYSLGQALRGDSLTLG